MSTGTNYVSSGPITNQLSDLDLRVTSLEYDIKRYETVIESLKDQLIGMDEKLTLLYKELESLYPRRIRLRQPV